MNRQVIFRRRRKQPTAA